MSSSSSDESDELPFAPPVLNTLASSAPPMAADSESDKVELAAAAAISEEESEESEEEAGPSSGLLSAEGVFDGEMDGDALELDPFRVAAGRDIPDRVEPTGTDGKKKKKVEAEFHTKLFVGGISHTTDEKSLIKAFSRYGKVKEGTIPRNDKGVSRGFAFVTYVKVQGAKFILKELGEDGKMSLDGREVVVRYAEKKDNHGAGLHKVGQRGSVAYLGNSVHNKYSSASKKSLTKEWAGGDDEDDGGIGPVGVAALAAAQRRQRDPPRKGGGGGGGEGEGQGEGEGGEKRGKKRKQKQEIVTVSKRQDAEVLYDKKITMKEIFPKEFWRI